MCMTNRNLAVALYRPHPGKEEELLKIVYTHIPTLRAENLITSREPMLLQSEDGTIIEIFEWLSEAATEKAHHSPAVMKIWDQLMAVAEMVSLSSLPEAGQPFPNFKSLK
jgi:quinol monooxygenase YgiN